MPQSAVPGPPFRATFSSRAISDPSAGSLTTKLSIADCSASSVLQNAYAVTHKADLSTHDEGISTERVEERADLRKTADYTDPNRTALAMQI